MIRIVKIGGNSIDDDAQLEHFLKAFSKIPKPKILIHGGGKMATYLANKLALKNEFKDGRRITDAASLDICTMVYAGLINKKIVSKLQAYSCNAIGLSGADGNSIISKKRSVKSIDFGWVGDIEQVNGKFIQDLLSKGLTPVFCAITHDEKGQLLNTNADSLASEISITMRQYDTVNLTFCFEKNGVLSNPSDDNSWIPQLNNTVYTELKVNEISTAGMIPKLENAFYAKQNNVERVKICHSKNAFVDSHGTEIY
jgi:acetylglutamate kinase